MVYDLCEDPDWKAEISSPFDLNFSQSQMAGLPTSCPSSERRVS